ncbi:unnamed protein product [Brassica rapa subsp. trilocularis]
MRMSSASAAEHRPSAATLGGGQRDAESLFRAKPMSEIRNVESATRKNIEDKKEELRQLVGTRYRDLIDSADSIVHMKSLCESISANISSIHGNIRSLSSSSSVAEAPTIANPNSVRVNVYGIACRVKYLVDTPENIWGCLDESMFLEAAGRYMRAQHVQQRLVKLEGCGGGEVDQSKLLEKFPLLEHQWQIVESFKAQISQRSHERLLDQGLGLGAYVDALTAVAVVDELDPKGVLGLFLDSRRTWVLQKLNACSGDDAGNVVSVFCDVLSVIEVTVGQVGELFLQALTDMPLFYKTILSTPPASQLFGGIPNPEEEVALWKSFRDNLESVMVIFDKADISKACLSWLRECGGQIVGKVNGKHLIEAIVTGGELGTAEKLIRETMDSKDVLSGSLDWLKGVFGSEVELPWNRIREIVLEDDLNLWDEIFEKAFVERMKSIIDSRFDDLAKAVNVAESVRAFSEITGEKINFQAYLNRPSTGGGVWFIEPNAKKLGLIAGNKTSPEESDFQSCLTAYFGPEVSQMRDAVDQRCQNVLEDLLSFFESEKAGQRLKDLAPYVQNRCYDSVSALLSDVDKELEFLFSAIKKENNDSEAISPAIVIEKSLFMGRLLFALLNHSEHVPLILGSPRLWCRETMTAVSDKLSSLLRQPRYGSNTALTADSPGKQVHTDLRKQSSLAVAALLKAEEKTSPKFEELNKTMRDLCIKAHTLWIQWLSDELSAILLRDLRSDDGLSATTPLRGWEETIVKEEQGESPSELKISLPSLPSLYIISFLCRASEEIHRIGGHVLDKSILQKFASSLLEKIIIIYEDFVSPREANEPQISEKGVLQILLDLRFASDVLSGGDTSTNVEIPKSTVNRSAFRRKQGQQQRKSVSRGRIDGVISQLSQKLDPIDWLTYEPYLWENEKQSYLRHAVLFGFFVQLNRMYTDTAQKLPTNSESNIMPCSTVPRFKYLPISAPALSSRSTNKVSIPVTSNEGSSRNSWNSFTNGEHSQTSDLDDDSSFGVASPFLKSFMQNSRVTTMTETETIAAAINQIDEKKQKLKKAFDDLQSHRSLLSPSFPLSWSDIDSHFSSLQSSLSNRFRLLQSQPPSPNNASPRIETADDPEPPLVVIRPELRALCEKMDSTGLSKFLADHWDDDAMPNQELSAAFRYSPDPATMVLNAIDGSSKGKSVDVRRVFVLLMEALIEINDKNITLDTKEKAKKVADNWNTKINNKPFEALLFLHLLAAFELGSEFNSEELSRYVVMIAKYKQATLLCNKVCLDKERVGEVITKLLSIGKPILAVRFMYECGRTDGFEPVSVLKGYVKEAREAAERVCKEDKYSLKSQNEATDKEVSALRAVIKIIKDRNLEAEFSEERVEERVEELERQKAQRKRNVEPPQPKPKGRKRPRDRTQVYRQEAGGVMIEPSHHHGLQLNPFGVVNPARGGILGPYMSPVAAGLYGAAAIPQPVCYGQQAGFVMPPFHPSYYSQ